MDIEAALQQGHKVGLEVVKTGRSDPATIKQHFLDFAHFVRQGVPGTFAQLLVARGLIDEGFGRSLDELFPPAFLGARAATGPVTRSVPRPTPPTSRVPSPPPLERPPQLPPAQPPRPAAPPSELDPFSSELLDWGPKTPPAQPRPSAPPAQSDDFLAHLNRLSGGPPPSGSHARYPAEDSTRRYDKRASEPAPDPYANPYGAPPQPASDPFGANNPYAALEPPGTANPYGPPVDENPYGAPANPYGAPPADENPYGAPANPYGAPPVDENPYGAPDEDPYGAPSAGGGYGSSSRLDDLEGSKEEVEAEPEVSGPPLLLHCPPLPPIPLGTRALVQLGRGSNSDLVLPHQGVSRCHAVVRLIGDVWTIEDRSTYGTFVNGKKARTHDLEPGDSISIGPYVITVLEESQPEDDDTLPYRIPGFAVEGMHGRLFDVAMSEVLQQVEFNEKSGALTVRDGDTKGTICFYEGRPMWAELGALKDEEAVYSMLAMKQGEFSFVNKVEAGERTIFETVTGLLMEYSRREDELNTPDEAGESKVDVLDLGGVEESSEDDELAFEL